MRFASAWMICLTCLFPAVGLAEGRSILPGQPLDNGNPNDLRACYGESIEVELFNPISPSIRSLLEIRSPYQSEKWAFTDRLNGWSLQATEKEGLDATKCLAEPIRAVALRRRTKMNPISAILFANPALIVDSILLEASRPTEPRFRSREYWMGQVSPEMVGKPDDLGFTLSIPKSAENMPTYIAPEEITTPLGDPLVFRSCGFGFMSGCDVRYSLNENLRILYRFDPDVVVQGDWIRMDSIIRETILGMVSE